MLALLLAVLFVFNFLNKYEYFPCMHEYVHHMLWPHSQSIQNVASECGLRTPERGTMGSYGPPCKYWQLTSSFCKTGNTSSEHLSLPMLLIHGQHLYC